MGIREGGLLFFLYFVFNDTKKESETYEKDLQKMIDGLISLCNGMQQNLTGKIEELNE